MFAHMILNDELADVVASDAHSPYMRTPYLREVHEYISVHFSIDYADLLLAENPQKIIDGEVIL
jgi:protein-tyrosine phosphatase